MDNLEEYVAFACFVLLSCRLLSGRFPHTAVDGVVTCGETPIDTWPVKICHSICSARFGHTAMSSTYSKQRFTVSSLPNACVVSSY